MSSSGEVLPFGFSVRLAQLTSAPVQAPLLARSKVPEPLCRFPFQTTSARRSAVAMRSPICFLGYYALDPTREEQELIFERGVYPHLDVVFEGVGDRADLVRVVGGAPEAFRVEVRYAATHFEVHRGDPEPLGDRVQGAGGLDVYALRWRAALPLARGARHRVAARVRRRHELLGARALLLGARARGPSDGDLTDHPAAHGEATPPLLEGPLPTDLGPPPRQHHSFLPFVYETECYQSPGDDYPSASRRGRPPP